MQILIPYFSQWHSNCKNHPDFHLCLFVIYQRNNLITAMSDKNVTLFARKLSKARYRNLNKMEWNKYISYIPKTDFELSESEIRQTKWNNTT